MNVSIHPYGEGGCKLTCISRMSKSLLLTQVLRLLKSHDKKSIGYLTYWVGELIEDFLPEAGDGEHCIEPGEYFECISSLIVEAKLSEQIDENNWNTVVNKNLYSGFCSNLPSPKVEQDLGFSLKIAWKNLQHDYLNSSEREILFLLLHNKLSVRERMFRIGQAADPYCLWCLQHNVVIICDIDHFFCECERIVHIWNSIGLLVKKLLVSPTLESSSIIRLNMPVKRCPGVLWILGAYVSNIWNNSEGDICEAELFGYLKFKFKTAKLGTIAQMDTVSRLLS